jgi:hypothetical protein
MKHERGAASGQPVSNQKATNEVIECGIGRRVAAQPWPISIIRMEIAAETAWSPLLQTRVALG